MLKFYIKCTEALKRLRTDAKGVVSFEYVIVAACVVGAVALAFGTGTGGAITTALTTAIGSITAAVTSAAAGA
jgi:pilus assembly protein Flp/PilA